MAVAAASAIAQLRDELDRLATDPDADPADRLVALRGLRDDLAFLTGTADRYLADQDLQREGDAMDRMGEHLAARDNADARGLLLDAGLATPEQLDAAGLLSHDELDRRVEDGTIEEAVVGVAHLFDPQRHPRGRGGKFATSGGRVVPKGRRGQTLTAPGANGHRELANRPDEAPLRLGGVRTAAVRRELGSAVDTREKYAIPASPGTTGKAVYSPERTAQHRQMIEDLFADGGRGHGIPAEAQPEGERHLVAVAGGPASGKSSADEHMPAVGTEHGRELAEKENERRRAAGEKELKESDKKLAGSVEIDQDWFKNKIAEYQHLAAEHDPYASDAAHREAADLAHQARLEAMRRGYNIVMQGTGDSGPRQFSNKLVEAHKQGYRVHAFGVSAPTDVAMGRAQGRAAATGRAVPEAGLRAMHANVSRRWKDVEAIAPEHLESLQLFDSREDTRKGGKARLMEHLDPKSRKLTVDNPERMQEFRDKERENPGALIKDPSYV